MNTKLRIASVAIAGLVALGISSTLLELLDHGRPVRAADSPGSVSGAGDVLCVRLHDGGPFASCTQVFTNVQTAVAAATDGETIKIATGVYTSVDTLINKQAPFL